LVAVPPEAVLPRIVKDCFGTVISTLHKMKECVRCELLAECRSINWSGGEADSGGPTVVRRPLPGGDGDGDAAPQSPR
jgi:hypothetical protein